MCIEHHVPEAPVRSLPCRPHDFPVNILTGDFNPTTAHIANVLIAEGMEDHKVTIIRVSDQRQECAHPVSGLGTGHAHLPVARSPVCARLLLCCSAAANLKPA